MKKIFLTFLIACFSIACYAQDGVKWETGTFQDALNKAKNNKKGPKLIFMDCYTTWCGPCKQMANVVFPTKEAGAYFNKNFVNFKSDMEKGEGIELAKKYAIRAYPTFLILDSEGNEVGRLLGSDKLDSFISRVEKALDPANSPAGLLAKYESSREMSDAYTYLEAVSKMYMNDKVTEFIKNNYDSLSPRERYSSKMWAYISKCISLKDQTMLNKVIEDKSNYDSKIGKSVVDKEIVSAVNFELSSYMAGREDLSKEAVQKGYMLTTLLGAESNKYEILIAKLANYYADKNIDAIVKALDPYYVINMFSSNEIGRINYLVGALKEIPSQAKTDYLTKVKAYHESQVKGITGQLEKIK